MSDEEDMNMSEEEVDEVEEASEEETGEASEEEGGESADEEEDEAEKGDEKAPDPTEKKQSLAKRNQIAFPLARVRRIMKVDQDVKLISADANVLVAKSTELLIQYLVERAQAETTRKKRKIMKYDDVARAVAKNDNLFFLADSIPERTQLKKKDGKYIQTTL
eukprot:TRINITY_DN18319_c0_g1_i1.p1 TRINITY_DN18319_c0_g1~~TRINITY_DN18319_c0_g1_i1.p1  ORF type:complete len:185 (+),score=84.51 TRINITY_DN18319_c0_g1_i1:67-555(+)